MVLVGCSRNFHSSALSPTTINSTAATMNSSPILSSSVLNNHSNNILLNSQPIGGTGSRLHSLNLGLAGEQQAGASGLARPGQATTTTTTGQPTAGNNSQQQVLQQLFDDMRQIEDTVDSIEIPARGRCKVFMAKYGYDPFKQSPNDNPDAELAFNAGDYIMVFDDIDEDGYFIGELMDGRRGYVPSNWLDRLVGEDLFEFQASTLYKKSGELASSGNLKNFDADLDSELNSFPPEFYDALLSDTLNHSNFQHLLAPEDYQRMNDYVDLDDVDEVDDECLSDYERAEAEQMRRAVPPPQRLILERQLNKSILIGWLHPAATKGTIISYQVYVDGVLKSTVPSGDRTKALLEGVDSNIPHRISVRAIDLTGRHSNDAGCTIVIGRNVPFAPSCVKASHITSDSALISWLPCNSNFHHVVAVNSVEVQTVRPGVYKHLINGLSANTLYRVWVRAKPGKILSIDEKNPKKLESLTTYVDFKTMPKSLPDPPVNVQVEAGPQRRTLLVTWLPLTLNDFGSSNGCAVTGYAVFAGHKKLADIDSPTSDHALLDINDLESLHKKSVTVRTKSGENLSQDSMPCQIPDEYLKSNSGGPHNLGASGKGLEQQHPASHLGTNAAGIRHGSAHHHPHHNHHQRLSSDTGQQSPLRVASQHHRPAYHQQQLVSNRNRHYSNLASGHFRNRQLGRSLQNLESDLDSRRSSIPGFIEGGARNAEASQHQPAESYSEEEFENSMRFRGARGQARHRQQATGSQRYRARQSHSVDSSVNQLAGLRYQQQSGSLARLRGGSQTPTQAQLDPRDIKYFVALFDYDPSTMSPNPNAASEELAFKEGSIIKIIGEKGPDGFYRGELDNHFGYVPCNVVSEITDPNILYNLQEKNRLVMQQQQQQQVSMQLNQQAGLPANNSSIQQALAGIKRMVALYDYDPQENSPNADTESEIPFKVADVIYVYGKMDTDGFYMGEVERTKQTGLVPSNFLREEPLPANGKLPQSVCLLAQQQLMLQQQKPFIQTNNQLGQLNGQEPFQAMQHQQRPLNPGQAPLVNLAGNPVQLQQQQQQLQAGLMDPSNQANKMQPLQAQQAQMRANFSNIRPGGLLPANLSQQQQQPVQNQLMQQPNNINRPTSLSLGMSNGGGQQQQQQAAPLPLHQGQLGGEWPARAQMLGPNGLQQPGFANPGQQNAMLLNQQQQQVGMAPQMMQQGNLMQAQQQQQPLLMNNQQQQQGGFVSNLLAGGKQIIGAATTPRAPNQPGQFPLGNAQQQQQLVNNPAEVGFGALNQQQHLQQNRSNLIQNAFNSNDPSAGAIHNSFGMTGGGGGNINQQQPQHQQQHAQLNSFMGGMGARGPPPMMANQQQMAPGEEQGGNILNTVKNMFKL